MWVGCWSERGRPSCGQPKEESWNHWLKQVFDSWESFLDTAWKNFCTTYNARNKSTKVFPISGDADLVHQHLWRFGHITRYRTPNTF